MAKALLVVALLAVLGAGGYYLYLNSKGNGGAVGVAASGGKGATPAAGTATGTAAKADTKAETKKVRPPPFSGWAQPAVAILLTADQHGYFEPCGCSLEQLGGVSRRADLIRQMRDKKWPVVPLDAGGLVNPKRVGRTQTQPKFDMTLDALKKMEYAAVALGVEELKLSAGTLLSKKSDELPFVCCNLILLGSLDLGIPERYRVIDAGGLKVGVTGVFGASVKDDTLPAGNDPNADITFLDPVEELAKVLDEMKEAGAEVTVLLSHAKMPESEKLAEQFSDKLDIVLSAQMTGDPDPTPKRVGENGKTLVVLVGDKAKHVGVVGVFPQDPENRLRYELVHIDKDRFEETPMMVELMRSYQETLATLKLAETEPTIDHPSGAMFIGSERCGRCHTQAYSKWKTTNHAHAYESLSKGRKEHQGEWISRIHDPECLACHVTGWNPQDILRYTSGFESEEKSKTLLGQGCENCHGPGSVHEKAELAVKKKPNAETRELANAWRKNMHLDRDLVNQRNTCIRCHDADNSPNFDFEKYWPKVAHPGRN